MSDRRLLLTRATKILALIGIGFVLYPFFAALLPDSGVGSDRQRQWLREIELSGLQPGELLRIDDWPGGPVAVYRRTPRERDSLARGMANPHDPHSHSAILPADFASHTRSLLPDYFVFIPVEPVRGCQVRVLSADRPPDAENAWPGGFVDPCSGVLYDSAGRIHTATRGTAPENLRVPSHRLIGKTRIQLLPR